MPSPGASQPAILLVGEDIELLDTRAAVLRNTGAEVECLRSAQVPESAGLQAFDLIILCHTLGEPEARTIADAAERLFHRGAVRRVLQQRLRIDDHGVGLQRGDGTGRP